MSLITVIVPVYNGEKFIRECLESIRSQTFQDFKVLVVNDGSTDNSFEIIEEFVIADSRFEIISVPNGGVSRARNLGIDKASGRYITFVDADDVLMPDFLKISYREMIKREAQVAICKFIKGKTFIGRDPIGKDVKVEEYDYISAMKRALYQKRILNSPWGVLFEKKLLEDSPDGKTRFREGIRYEDLDAFYRFFEKARKIIYIDTPLYFYRENAGGFIHSWSPARLDVLDVTDRLVEFFSLYYPQLKNCAHDRRFSAHYNMLLLILKNSEEKNQAESYMRCLKVVKEGRRRALIDPSVRIKNKAGALLSYLGPRFIKMFSRIY